MVRAFESDQEELAYLSQVKTELDAAATKQEIATL
jgi:hypothetical protein